MHSLSVALVLGAWCTLALGQGIFTCIDSKGRRLTADRPIQECLDREQKELNSSGSTKRNVGPSLTVDEQAVEDEKARKLQEERFRLTEEKRRDRALLTRYPNKTIHDRERAIALEQVDGVIATAKKGVAELTDQAKSLATEAEFFKNDPAKLPPRLKRAMEDNEKQQAAQKRFMDEQATEKQRVNARFDVELVRLKVLWTQIPSSATVPATAKK